MATATSEIDALFQLPLGEFTAARNALATKLKQEQRADEAAQVKALTKPPVSAWVVNQLYWQHRTAFERLMTAGDRVRSAQASQLRGKGGEMQEPLEARRVALSELTQHATTLLRESGHAPSPDLMRRVTTTLEALATHGSRAAASAVGRLTDDVQAPGFEALAALAPEEGGGKREHDQRRVLPFVSQRERTAARAKLPPEERKRQEEAERAAASTALKEAERSLTEARKNAERAEAALKKAAARAKEAKKEQDGLSARLEKASAAAEAARQEAHRVASEAEEAAQTVADAERILEEARRRLKELTD